MWKIPDNQPFFVRRTQHKTLAGCGKGRTREKDGKGRKGGEDKGCEWKRESDKPAGYIHSRLLVPTHRGGEGRRLTIALH